MSQGMLHRLAIAALLVAALLYGSTYVVLKDLVQRLPPADMLAVRFGIASVVLIACAPRSLRMSRRTLRQGTAMGLLFGVSGILQTYGLADTSPSIAGFVTGLYVVFTPLLAAIFHTAKVTKYTWPAVALSAVGLAALSYNPDGGGVSLGALLVLVSAIGYAGHIVVTGHASNSQTAMSLTVVQTVTMALVSLVAAIPGGLSVPTSAADWWAMGYLAVLCSAATFFMQTWGQSHIDPTSTAVILCSEPLWSAIFSVTLGWELLTVRILIGGATILASMLLTSLADRIPYWFRRP